MFWNLLWIIGGFIFGLLLIFDTESFDFLSWAIRHNVDDKGEKSQLIALRFFGILIIVICVWSFFEFIV